MSGGGPVLITGLADTGKTPLARMLTEGTSFVVTRHTQLWSRFADRVGDPLGPKDLERWLSILLQDPAVARLRPDPDRLRASLQGRDVTTTDLFVQLHAQYAAQLGKGRWGEQCGGVDTDTARLLRDLPAARVIHLVRDPVASFQIGSNRSGRGPGRLGRFTARWVASVELARRNVERFPGRYLLLRYEALALRTDATMRAVCRFLNEPSAVERFTFVDLSACEGDVAHAGGHDKYAPGAAEVTSGGVEGDTRFLEVHAAGHLRRLGYRTPPSAISRLSRAYVMGWPANRLALMLTRGPVPTVRPTVRA